MVNATSHRSAKLWGYALLRLAIGMSMFIHGVTRLGHTGAFAEGLVKMFAPSALPRAAVLAFGWITPSVELLIGVLLLLGFLTRWGLMLGGCWMVALIFGSTLLEKYDVVSIQLLYALIFSYLLQNIEANVLAVDHLLSRYRTDHPQ